MTKRMTNHFWYCSIFSPVPAFARDQREYVMEFVGTKSDKIRRIEKREPPWVNHGTLLIDFWSTGFSGEIVLLPSVGVRYR